MPRAKTTPITHAFFIENPPFCGELPTKKFYSIEGRKEQKEPSLGNLRLEVRGERLEEREDPSFERARRGERKREKERRENWSENQEPVSPCFRNLIQTNVFRGRKQTTVHGSIYL